MSVDEKIEVKEREITVDFVNELARILTNDEVIYDKIFHITVICIFVKTIYKQHDTA